MLTLPADAIVLGGGCASTGHAISLAQVELQFIYAVPGEGINTSGVFSRLDRTGSGEVRPPVAMPVAILGPVVLHIDEFGVMGVFEVTADVLDQGIEQRRGASCSFSKARIHRLLLSERATVLLAQ